MCIRKMAWSIVARGILVEYEQHVAVRSSSDQPEIEHIIGTQDPSSIPTARSHIDSGQEIFQDKDLENIWS